MCTYVLMYPDRLTVSTLFDRWQFIELVVDFEYYM